MLVLPVAAVAGTLVGWCVGRAAGAAVFGPGSRILRARHVERARAFFARHGARTIVLARFVPVVRTFAAVMAGATRMDFRRFAFYSVVGGVAWTAGLTLLGFWLGHVPLVREHVELFVLGVVIVSLLPIAIEARRAS